MGEIQYPSHLTTLEEWKRWPSRAIGAIEGGVLWLGVRLWMSSGWGPRTTCLCPGPLQRSWRKLFGLGICCF